MKTQNMAQLDGCLPIEDFARRHGIQPAILQAHILVGLVKGGMKEHVAAERCDQPLRGRWGCEYYLTPEQQQAALDFWERHGVPYNSPE